MKNQNGSSLVEVIISMFMLTVVLLCVAGHAGVVIKQTSMDKNYTVASTLIQDKMEEMKQTKYDNVVSSGDSVVKNGAVFYRTWTATASNGNIKTVNLIIDWAPGKTVRSSMIVSQQ